MTTSTGWRPKCYGWPSLELVTWACASRGELEQGRHGPDDPWALTACGRTEVLCLPCHRPSWNPCGSSCRRCCPPARSTTRWAATGPASPTGSSSTSSSSCWCSAAVMAGSQTTPAPRPRCVAVVTSGSPLGWPSSCAWRCWPPTTACTAWSWSSWRWMGAPPRRPAAARPPAQA